MRIFNILLIGILNTYLVFSIPADNQSSEVAANLEEEVTDVENLVDDDDAENIVEVESGHTIDEEEDSADDDDDDDEEEEEEENDENKMSEYEIEHINILDEHLGECTVLLRRNGDFPLAEDERKIHLYGGGIRHTIKGGTGSGDINIRQFDNIETAFKNGGFEILSNDYLDAYDACYQNAHDTYINHLKDEFDRENPFPYLLAHFSVILNEPECENLPVAKEGDVAIFVVSRVSGEGVDRVNDKGDALLTDTERNTILTLAKGFKKFLLVLNTGGPVDLSGLDEVKNILVLSQLGTNTSKALVDLITGEKYPSGKLATTWTKNSDYFASMGNLTDVDYVEGVYVGYRYFDSADVDVMFPFGFGLSYTDFKFKFKRVKLIGDKVIVEASVKNIGKFNGKEILELYLSKPQSKLDEPYQQLVSFAKSEELEPKDSETLRLEFNLSDFPSYDSKSQSYILNAGSYVVRLGNSSRNTIPVAIIEVPSKVTVKKVKNQIGDPGFKDMTFRSKKKDNLKGVKKLKLNVKSIKTETVNYSKQFEISDVIKGLTTEEKVKFVVGAHADDPNGSYQTTVAGVAGEFYKFGDLKPAVLSDGPAGVNIARDYYIDESGPHNTKGTLPESALEIVPDDLKDMFAFLFPKIPDVKLHHQFTTAIPIGTALAQSWNIEFAEKCGDIVGTEMTIFHLNLWLAPALNIHRSILNGRNFEYYSEDPLISGMMAAFVTKGVQQHKGKYVTLKHYTANNKENNRFGVSSNMSERAFREIYLRGFEIAIKKSNPGAVMSSFNLVNGIHVSHSYNIIANVLRKENNYDNVIMTDWTILNMALSDKYPDYSPAEIIKSTHDVIMPGSKNFYDMVLEAVNEKTVTIEELEQSATRILKFIEKVQE